MYLIEHSPRKNKSLNMVLKNKTKLYQMPEEVAHIVGTMMKRFTDDHL